MLVSAAKMRLVFVSDQIPSELRRIVEFLNTQMSPAQVLAVEVTQYLGDGVQTLVPRMVGQTADAEMRKRREVRKWDEPSLLAEIERLHGSEEADVARHIIHWSKTHFPRLVWGKGLVEGGVWGVLDLGDHAYSPFGVSTRGRVDVYLNAMGTMPPFDDEAKRVELIHRLNQMPGVNIPDDAVRRVGKITLNLLVDPKSLAMFFAAVEWFFDQARLYAGDS